jgi:hypothetical protein
MAANPDIQALAKKPAKAAKRTVGKKAKGGGASKGKTKAKMGTEEKSA